VTAAANNRAAAPIDNSTCAVISQLPGSIRLKCGEPPVNAAPTPALSSSMLARTRLRRSVPDLDAAEVFLQAGLELVCSAFDRPAPFASTSPCYLLVEAAGADDPTDRLGAAVADLDGVRHVAVATDGRGRAELWRYREEHTLAINTLGAPHKFDVTLPAAELAAFSAAVPAAVAAVVPQAEVWIFGHLGDGNLHVNVTGAAPDDESLDDAVLRLVVAHGGSISAEHGIGRAKQRWLALNRSPVERAVFAALKAALDPRGTLNPGVLVDPPTASAP
jgi:FAD/FMN-containing dehydrogenase